jgi:hypothetical protein
MFRFNSLPTRWCLILWLGLFFSPGERANAETPPPKDSDKSTPNSAQESAQASAPDKAALDTLKAQIDALKSDYEKRIKDLENQVEQLQVQMLKAAPEPEVPPQAAPVSGTLTQTIPGALNPAIAVVGNFVGRIDDQKVYGEDGTRIDNKMNLREAELDFRVPIDPYADGVLITAIGSDVPGSYSIDIEEGYFNLKKLPFLDRPPLGLKFKIGRFRPNFNQFNILHTHDLPQTFRSLPTQEFLGEEGFNKNGLSTNFFLPTPWDRNSSLDATVEVLTGGDIAISPNLNGRVSYLGHLRWFRTFKEAHNVNLGWSTYYHASGNQVPSATLNGIDFAYRWKPLRQGEWKSYILGGELMFAPHSFPQAQEPEDVTRAINALGLLPGPGKPRGYSVFTQWQFDRRKYAGVRWDSTDTAFNAEYHRHSITPYFNYYLSEFLRFRINYEHRWSDFFTENGRNAVYMELNFVFGAHPPEPFWVNK